VGFSHVRFTVGFDVGFNVGFEVGFGVGFSVGFKVGFNVGFIVGFNVGFNVGFDVGFSVGFSVGFNVGFKVGSCVVGSAVVGRRVLAITTGLFVGFMLVTGEAVTSSISISGSDSSAVVIGCSVDSSCIRVTVSHVIMAVSAHNEFQP